MAVKSQVSRALDLVLATVQNGLEVVRYGGLETGTKPTQYQVVDTEPMYKLRRYFSADNEPAGPPVILVPPMMVSANVYDVTELNGAVSILHKAGIDPWVVDFGSPDQEQGGRERTLTDHVVAVSEVVDRVREYTGQDVHLSGYSQGGMFCYQAAAYRQSKGIASLITYGSPVDVLAALPLGLPASVAAPAASFLADNVFNRLEIKGWMARTGFQLLDPVKTAKARIDFLLQLHDREALLPREDQRRFLQNEGWVAWAGPAVAELLRSFVAHNRMIVGGFVINDHLVTLAEIDCPVLCFVGTADDIGQPASVRGILRAAPRAEIFERSLPVGHFGLVVGTSAGTHTWPTVADWINWRATGGEQPVSFGPMKESEVSGSGVTFASRVAHGLNSVAEAGTGVGRDLVGAASAVTRNSRAVLRESIRTLPRLMRLGQIQAGTRISLGKLMSENAERTPERELFLFENRVLSHQEVNKRIDNVVAGLLSTGVRPGQQIGVVMETRPSALVTIAALSRIGAVAVMLPPDEQMGAALQLAECRTVVVDPVNLPLLVGNQIVGDQVVGNSQSCCPGLDKLVDRILVLGGGDTRKISVADGHRIIDMEQIDPELVEIPSWYRPDPGSAADLGFIIFAKRGNDVVKSPITNHRWALSAFGAASAAALTKDDTVYCLTPLHHASGLLTTLGATVVGGARIALSAGITPETFSEEVHRYGVSVVSYTWSMLKDVVRSADLRVEAHNPIRLFMGSGMSVGLWRDVLAAFPAARVVEFFATADGSAILANVAGNKLGSMGRPLPETNKVRLAAFDIETEQLLEAADGYIREPNADEVGLLLAAARTRYELGHIVLRDVFGPKDRWETTDNIFRIDAQGDYWLLGTTNTIMKSLDGPVYPQPIVDALSEVEQVDQVVVYGVGEAGMEVSVAALSLRPRAGAPSMSAIRLAVAALPIFERPHIVHVVENITVSSSFRPLASSLRAQGIPEPGTRVWFRDGEGKYRRLTPALAQQQEWITTAQGNLDQEEPVKVRKKLG